MTHPPILVFGGATFSNCCFLEAYLLQSSFVTVEKMRCVMTDAPIAGARIEVREFEVVVWFCMTISSKSE